MKCHSCGQVSNPFIIPNKWGEISGVYKLVTVEESTGRGHSKEEVVNSRLFGCLNCKTVRFVTNEEVI